MKIGKNRLWQVLVITAVLSLFINNQSAFADFSGDFAPDKWTYSETDPGFSGSLNSTTMVLTSSDTGPGYNVKGLYSITIPNGASKISFTFSS